MAILPRYTERIEYKLEILPNTVIQCRAATIVEKDGVEVGRSYHRTTYHPGDDVSTAPAEVQKVSRALWRPDYDLGFGVDPAEGVDSEFGKREPISGGQEPEPTVEEVE